MTTVCSTGCRHEVLCRRHSLQLIGRGNAQGVELAVAIHKKVGIGKAMCSATRTRLVVNGRPCDAVGRTRRERRSDGKGQAVQKGIFQALEEIASFHTVRQVGSTSGARKVGTRIAAKIMKKQLICEWPVCLLDRRQR